MELHFARNYYNFQRSHSPHNHQVQYSHKISISANNRQSELSNDNKITIPKVYNSIYNFVWKSCLRLICRSTLSAAALNTRIQNNVIPLWSSIDKATGKFKRLCDL